MKKQFIGNEMLVKKRKCPKEMEEGVTVKVN